MTPSFRRRTTALAASAAFLLAAGAIARSAAPNAPALYASSQASVGSKAYETNCSSCHGENLEGGAGPALSGPNLKTLSKNTKLTVGDLFTFMYQEMPMNAPASLSHDQYVSIMAFILKSNGYPSGSKPLTFDTAKSSKVTLTSLKGG